MQQNQKNIILHVGLHKTGTTFLQKQVFPFLEDTYLTGIYLENANYDKFHHEFWHLGVNYKNNPNFTNKNDFEELKKYINNFINNIEESNFLFSFETLFGNCWKSYHNNFENTEILKEIFPEAKIFIVVRKQDEWAESAYAHYGYKGNNPIKINSFMDYKSKKFITGKNLSVSNLNWIEYIENYIEKFNKENVLVLPYEMLKKNPEEFLSRFYKFFELKPYFPKDYVYENKRIPLGIKKSKLLSFCYNNFLENLQNDKLKIFLRKNDRSLRKLLDKIEVEFDYSKETLTKKQKEEILKIHEQSNRKLSEIVGIDLGQYGYY